MTLRIVAANVIVRLRSLSRERSAMFFTLAFPVILVLVFGAIFTKPERANFDLPVQDLDGSESSAAFVASLGAGGAFRTSVVPAEADAIAFTREHRHNLVLVIPRGFGESSAARQLHGNTGAPVTLRYVHDPSSTSVTTKLGYLSEIVARTNQAMAGGRPFLALEAQSILERKLRFIEFFVPGIIAMAIMTSSLSGALHMNAELRQKGILRKLSTTPITRADWLLASIVYQLVLAAASTAAILAVSYAVFDVRLEINGWLPLYTLLEVVAFVGLGMVLTPLAREAESAAAAGNAFLFPMMFLSGTFFPVEMMPGFLQTVAKGLPLYYVNEGLRAGMIFGDGAAALRSAVITAGVAGVVFVAGAAVTRWDREA